MGTEASLRALLDDANDQRIEWVQAQLASDYTMDAVTLEERTRPASVDLVGPLVDERDRLPRIARSVLIGQRTLVRRPSPFTYTPAK